MDFEYRHHASKDNATHDCVESVFEDLKKIHYINYMKHDFFADVCKEHQHHRIVLYQHNIYIVDEILN